MQKRRNGFLVFCFSFLPGAAEMFMGFMKQGVSLLGMFMASVFVVSVVSMPELSVLPALIYIYSFFHAHNIAGLNDEKFMAMEDEYLFGLDNIGNVCEQIKVKYKKWIAAVLIIIGVVMIWRTGIDVLGDYIGYNSFVVRLLYKISDYAPRCIIGLAVIVAGVKLIAGKKEEE